jgi:GDYXXLXY protein
VGKGLEVGWPDRVRAAGSGSNGVHWRAEKVTVVKPAAGPFLKGHMGPYGSLKFGIEAYYVQEGTGRVYEQVIRDRRLSAELAVTSSGQAALRGLRIE